MTPLPSFWIAFMAYSSWGLQSHLSEPSTSPVKQEEWTRAKTCSCFDKSPMVMATHSSWFSFLKTNTLKVPNSVGNKVWLNRLSKITP